MIRADRPEGPGGARRAAEAAPDAKEDCVRWRALLIFAFAFLVTSALVNALLSTVYRSEQIWVNTEDEIRSRIFREEIRRRDSGDYGLFFGPSTAVNGIVPRVFDETLRTQGVDTYSFNLGAVGAGGHEVDFIARNTIRALLDDNLPLPQWVVVDLTVPHTYNVVAGEDLEVPNLWSLRSERWHTVYQTRSVIRTILRDASSSTAAKAVALLSHIAVFVKYNLNIAGKWHTFDLIHVEEEDTPMWDFKRRIVRDRRGYRPFNQTVDAEERRRFLEEKLPAYLNAIEKKKNINPARYAESHDYNHEAVAAQARFFEKHAIRVAYVIAPTHKDTRFAHLLAMREDLPPFLFYDDPETWPEYYRPENRQDVGHLSNETAEVFTRRLALDLVRRGFYDPPWNEATAWALKGERSALTSRASAPSPLSGHSEEPGAVRAGKPSSRSVE